MELERVLTSLRERFKEEVAARDELRASLQEAEKNLSQAATRADGLQAKVTALMAEVAYRSRIRRAGRASRRRHSCPRRRRRSCVGAAV